MFPNMSRLQVAAALVRYAEYCVSGCSGTASVALHQHPPPESAAEIMDATQQHAGLLLQVASNQQVSASARTHRTMLC